MTGIDRFEKNQVFLLAGVAQLVEHHLAKVDVEGSNPFARSIFALKAADLFNFPDSLPFSRSFDPDLCPWEWVNRIKQALENYSFGEGQAKSEIPGGFQIGPMVFLHPSVKLPANGCIIGPAYISEGCEIRPGAYIRENVIAGKNCVLGNACEYKNSLLMDNVQTPHFNYIGDSVLGNQVHLGAGSILANLRFDQAEVMIKTEKGVVGSGLRKLGGLLADGVEIGCNTTLMPGSILHKNTKLAPSTSFGGTLYNTR